MAKPKPPKCDVCGAPQPMAIAVRPSDGMNYGVYEWLCGDCVYKRDHPDALPRVPLPAERRTKPKQKETLFDALGGAT